MALQTVNVSVVTYICILKIVTESALRLIVKITGLTDTKHLAELLRKMAAVLMVLLWLFLVHKNVGDEQYVL